MGRYEPSLTVQDDGEGDATRAIPQPARDVDDLHLGDEHRVADRHLGSSLATFIHRIDGDPHNLQAVRCKFLLNPDQTGDLLAAWRAPARPEVYDHHFPAPVLER